MLEALKGFHLYSKGYPPKVADAMPEFEHALHKLQVIAVYDEILTKQHSRIKDAISEVRNQLADMTTSDPGIALNKAMISPEFGITLKLYQAQQSELMKFKPFMHHAAATCAPSEMLRLGVEFDKQGLMTNHGPAKNFEGRRLDFAFKMGMQDTRYYRDGTRMKKLGGANKIATRRRLLEKLSSASLAISSKYNAIEILCFGLGTTLGVATAVAAMRWRSREAQTRSDLKV